MRALINLPLTLDDPDETLPIADYTVAIPAIAGLLGWYSARTGYVTKDGANRVSALLDRSGNGVDFTQGTAGAQPLYVEDQLNGQAVIDFDSVRGDRMTWGGVFPTGDHTKVIVLRPEGVATTQNILSTTTASNGRHTLSRVFGTETVRMGVDSGAEEVTVDTAVEDDAWAGLIGSFDSAAGKLTLKANDAAAVTNTNAAAAVAVTNLFLGGPNGATGQLNGQVADILIFGIDLFDPANAAALATVQNYIQDTYGVAML